MPATDIARDLGEADQLALCIADGIDDDQRPEAGTVLAQPPGLVIETAFVPRGRQSFRGPLREPVLLDIEDREMLAEDFLFRIAVDRFGAGVPAIDIAFRVEHADRVVDDGAYEQFVTCFVRGSQWSPPCYVTDRATAAPCLIVPS